MDQQDMTSLAHPGGGQLLADAATAATCSTAGCYVKQLSPSDAACSKQIKLPKAEARRLLGELRHKQRALVTVLDHHNVLWQFLCTCYGCQYALSRVAVFCNTYKLRAGMYLALYHDSLKRLRIAITSSAPFKLAQPQLSSKAAPAAAVGTKRRSPSSQTAMVLSPAALLPTAEPSAAAVAQQLAAGAGLRYQHVAASCGTSMHQVQRPPGAGRHAGTSVGWTCNAGAACMQPSWQPEQQQLQQQLQQQHGCSWTGGQAALTACGLEPGAAAAASDSSSMLANTLVCEEQLDDADSPAASNGQQQLHGSRHSGYMLRRVPGAGGRQRLHMADEVAAPAGVQPAPRVKFYASSCASSSRSSCSSGGGAAASTPGALLAGAAAHLQLKQASFSKQLLAAVCPAGALEWQPQHTCGAASASEQPRKRPRAQQQGLAVATASSCSIAMLAAGQCVPMVPDAVGAVVQQAPLLQVQCSAAQAYQQQHNAASGMLPLFKPAAAAAGDRHQPMQQTALADVSSSQEVQSGPLPGGCRLLHSRGRAVVICSQHQHGVSSSSAAPPAAPAAWPAAQQAVSACEQPALQAWTATQRHASSGSRLVHVDVDEWAAVSGLLLLAGAS